MYCYFPIVVLAHRIISRFNQNKVNNVKTGITRHGTQQQIKRAVCVEQLLEFYEMKVTELLFYLLSEQWRPGKEIITQLLT
jgi:hypothetical protein